MKKHLLIMVMLFPVVEIAFVPNASAQAPMCFEQPQIYNTINNGFDWRTNRWPAYYDNSVGGTQNDIISPFYDFVYGANVFEISILALKDYAPEDGWELVHKGLGTFPHPGLPSGAKVHFPYVILYNKYNAKLRVLLAVAQQYTEFASGGKNNVVLSLRFAGGKESSSYRYQTNALGLVKSPVNTLSDFSDKVEYAQVNKYENYVPTWLYADFPMLYDPCTCLGKSIFILEPKIINTGNIDAEIKSQPYKKPVVNGNANSSSSDLLTTIAGQLGVDYNFDVKGGYEAFRNTASALSALGTSVQKQTNLSVPDKLKLEGDFSLLQQAADWAKLVPAAGTAVSSVLSLVDFFSSSGKKTSAGPGPSPVMIMNDFKMTGSIVFDAPKGSIRFAVPGSNQVGVNPEAFPEYNNILGVFNLVKKPKVQKYYREVVEIDEKTTCQNPTDPTTGITWVGTETNFFHKKGFREYGYRITEPLEYVINPAADINWQASEIKAALYVSDCGTNPNVYETNGRRDLFLEPNAKQYVRTDYLPIGCANQPVLKFKYSYEQKYTNTNCYKGAQYRTYLVNDYFNHSYLCTPKAQFVKITARLRRNGFENDADKDIVFIANYPVEEIQAVGTTDVANLYTPQDLPFSQVFDQNMNITNTVSYNALDNILINNAVISVTGNSVYGDFNAGQQITVENSTIEPNNGGVATIYATPPSALASCSAPKAPMPPADILTFCNSSVYNVPSRGLYAAREGMVDKEPVMIPEIHNFNINLYPNPFSNSTVLVYELPEEENVHVEVVDITGRSMGVLLNGMQDAGRHSFTINGSEWSPGIYLCKFTAGGSTVVKRLVVVK